MIHLAVMACIVAMAAMAGFYLLLEPGPHGRLEVVRAMGERWLFRVGWVDQLSEAQHKPLYLSVCTRQCHSQTVIENRSRTAMEWDAIVTRMRTTERSGKKPDISEREAAVVLAYLKKQFLSNIPTVLPDAVMQRLKQHLWRMDFGESDLFFDIIYLPKPYRSLLPYLVMKPGISDTSQESLFVIYVNTHQGTVPRWDLAQVVTLTVGEADQPIKPSAWQVIYEDDQQHHRQGLLTFPAMAMDEPQKKVMQMTLRLPNMKERVFQWLLPIPPLETPL